MDRLFTKDEEWRPLLKVGNRVDVRVTIDQARSSNIVKGWISGRIIAVMHP